MISMLTCVTPFEELDHQRLHGFIEELIDVDLDLYASIIRVDKNHSDKYLRFKLIGKEYFEDSEEFILASINIYKQSPIGIIFTITLANYDDLNNKDGDLLCIYKVNGMSKTMITLNDKTFNF